MISFDLWKRIATKTNASSCNALRKTCHKLNDHLVGIHREVLVQQALQTGGTILSVTSTECLSIEERMITERLKDVLEPDIQLDSKVFLRRLLFMVNIGHLMVIHRRLQRVVSCMPYQSKNINCAPNANEMIPDSSMERVRSCKVTFDSGSCERRKLSLETLATKLQSRIELLKTAHSFV
uniref:Uncharacterized protein n=1 Tax=Clandestinovirus TaxID=2831644 RepID=A0A8F8KPS8_9VIRU|nr:hypothetical protein KOM_12_296 [Clandestinovirus]